jgi:hypothetical protein
MDNVNIGVTTLSLSQTPENHPIALRFAFNLSHPEYRRVLSDIFCFSHRNWVRIFAPVKGKFGLYSMKTKVEVEV